MNKILTSDQTTALIGILKLRFEEHMYRHKNLDFAPIQAKLEASPEKLYSLNEMERTGGEPDVIAYDEQSDEFIFCDCAAESPKGRRNTCYDREGQNSRKENRPEHNAVDMAEEMGVEILTEELYQILQLLEKFDQKTSSWLKTPEEVRSLGGALFGDFRYGRVFTYHNGAQSYYAARGFRALLRV